MTVRGWRALTVSLVAVAVASAALPWFRAFPPELLLPVLVPLTVLPVGVTVFTAGGRRSAGPWWALGHLAVLAVVLVVGGAGQPFAFGAISDGYRDGLARLLSTTLPVTTAPDLLVIPVTAIWLTSTFAGELALRLRAFGGAAAVVLLGFAAAFAVTIESAGSALVGAACVGVAVLGMLGLPRRPTGPATDEADVHGVHGMTARSGALWAVAVLAVAFAAVPRLGPFDDPPVAPQRGVPVERQRLANPLATTSALRRGTAGVSPDDTLFTVTGVTRDSRYLALTQLDEYDGATWRLDRQFEPTGGRVPVDQDVTAPGAAEQAIELERLVHTPAGRWLPQAGRVRRVDGMPVRYEPLTGIVVPAGPTRVGDRYSTRSEVPVGQLGQDGVLAAPAGSHANQVPIDLGQELDRWIEAIAKGRNVEPAPTSAFLAAALAELRDRYAMTDDGGGTSFAEILGALGSRRSGNPEQFATLLALVARRAGADARVATGFRVGPASGLALPSSSDRVEVRGRDAWTWVIVPVVDVGWVIVDPTPDRSVPPTQARAAPGSTTTTTAPARPTTGGPRPTALTPIDTTPVTLPPGRATGRTGVVVLGSIVAIVVAAAAICSLAALARARRRRRRRRAVDPRWQVVGAWHELLENADRYRLVDGRQVSSCTATEAVALLARAGLEEPESTPVLVDTVNRSLYGPLPPSPGDIARVWQITDGLVVRASRLRTRGERLRDWFRRPTVDRRPSRRISG